MTRRDRVPKLRSTAGTFALSAFAMLAAACAAVPDLIFDRGDARADGGDARADGGDARADGDEASDSNDGSGTEASAQPDGCVVQCAGAACPQRCTECAATCQSGWTCCAKVSGPVMCKPPGSKGCP